MDTIVKMDFEKAVRVSKADSIQRMKSAVARMATENTQFQESMVEHREVLGELDRQMNTLGESCRNFQQSLKRIYVKPLRHKSLQLARSMDDWLDGQSTNAA